MRKYLALIKGGFLEGIAYKENFLTGLLANFIQVVVFYYVWKSSFLLCMEKCFFISYGDQWIYMGNYEKICDRFFFVQQYVFFWI